MVHGYHVIFAAYGFWLPNDPRGSWSDFVGKWELVRFGRPEIHRAKGTVRGRRADAPAAKQALAYPPVEFTGIQARAIGRGLPSCREE